MHELEATPSEPKSVGECSNTSCNSKLYEGFEYYEYDGEFFCEKGCIIDQLLDLQIISAVDL